MRFAFTDDQVAFTEAVRDLLAKECTPDVVRAAWESDDGRAPELWARLVDMGVVAMLAAEDAGGLGMTLVDLAPLLAESGRAGVPEPLSATTAIVVPALAGHALLEAVLAGEALVAVGLRPDRTVVGAEGATAFLLEADDGLHLVDAADVTVTPVGRSVDGTRRLSTVDWTPSDATLLAGGRDTAAAAFDRAALGAAAELCGLSDRMIELTTGYVGERKQFGVPIGSFQAIKRHLADALLAVEFAKPLVWRAAYSLAQGDPDASTHVSMAKAAASDAGTQVSETALQCHGAIGYTVEYDLHLFMKRTWALAARHGDAAWHRRRVAAALLD